MEKLSIFWFRRDLRLEDNHGLSKALTSPHLVLPVFIFDTNILDELSDKTDRRVDFIHDALQKLQKKLLGLGTSLHIIHDTPLSAFQKLLKKFQIAEVYTNHDYEPYANQRDLEVENLLAQHGIEFHTAKDQVIFEKAEVVKNDLSPYTVFTPYANAWKFKFHQQKNLHYPSENLTHQFLQTKPFHFPRLEELGFKKTDQIWSTPDLNEDVIKHYQDTRNIPAVDGTSRLSVHLRFGTISIRNVVAKANQLNPVWLNELIWREFFMQILYHFPRVVTESFKIKYDTINWRNDKDEFEAWCKGETGYPLVDAGMRELNATGFMHNRVRMVVASFLTKHLLIDWRWGEAYFAEKLLDYELSSNNGNWQWCAGCGCDAAPYFRIFNPTEQQRKFDPEFIYIKKWIPEFTSDYLPPIVDHPYARQRALDTYKKAVQNN